MPFMFVLIMPLFFVLLFFGMLFSQGIVSISYKEIDFAYKVAIDIERSSNIKFIGLGV